MLELHTTDLRPSSSATTRGSTAALGSLPLDAFQHRSIDFGLDRLPPSSTVASRVTTDAPADSTAVHSDGPILTEMEFVLTELRGACGLRPRLSPTTTATTPTLASVSATSPSEVSSAMTLVAPQVFDEMPQPYGFDNLNRHTVFRADGTEHSYYALPENYTVELATHEPIFDVCDEETDGRSHEFVDVFAGTPEQQTCEEEQQASDHLLKCVSNVTELKHTSACLTPTLDVQVFSCELQQQHDEKASHCQVLKASDSLVTRSNHFSMEQSMKELRLQWNPGNTKLSLRFMTAANATRLQCTYVSFPTINFSEILKHMVPLLSCWLFSVENRDKLQWDPGIAISSYSTPNAFTQVHYCCLPIVLDCSYSEPVQQLVCYSSILGSTETILSAMSMTSATTVHMTLVLSSGKIAQEEKNAAAVYYVFKIQLPMRKTSHIWDPGIESLLFLYIWLHVYMSQLVNCCPIQTCYLDFALLPPTQMSTHTSSNTKFGEHTSRCLGFHLHQIFQRCTAMSSLFHCD